MERAEHLWGGNAAGRAGCARGRPARARHDAVPPPTMSASSRPVVVPTVRLSDLDENSLVAACLAGCREAFDVIVERHRRPVYQLCYRYVGNHEDAADVAQEVFLRAYRALGSFQGQALLGTWLYRIAVNACLNRLAARPPASEPIETSVLADRGPDAASQLLGQERAKRVRAAIARLPRKQRTTLILRTYQELSHQQIASIVGSSVGAVKANFFHALRNLKRILEEDPV